MNRCRDSGLTLVEVLVSLSLFALIGTAGFAIIESILGVRERTEGRLARLGEIQRAMHLLRLDFEQASGERLIFDGSAVGLTRLTDDTGPVVIEYSFVAGVLQRQVSASPHETVQDVLPGTESVHWRFYRAGAGWLEAWPPPDRDAPGLPDAVAVEVGLEARNGQPGGKIRRVVRMSGGALR